MLKTSNVPSPSYRWGIVIQRGEQWVAVVWVKSRKAAHEYARPYFRQYAVARWEGP